MSDITGVTGVSDSSALSYAQAATAGSDQLDQQTFLNLLTTQMQHQDPLDPMSNEEFVAQLATFSSLEQLMMANGALESVYYGIASLNNAAMAGLVGTDVVALGDGISYSGEGDVELHFDAEADVANATVEITDSEGNVVWSGDIGQLEAGEGSWTWDGTDFDGDQVEEGEYTFSITGEDADGNEIEVTELIVGIVDEMDYSSGNPQPSVNGVTVDLADILRLTDGEDAAGDDGDGDEES